MSDTPLTTFKGGRGQKPTFSTLNLDTFDDTRATFARIIKAYGEGKISEGMGRSLTYMLASYLNYWKHADDLRIDKRLEELEEAERRRGGL